MLLQESARPTPNTTTRKLPFIMRLSPEARRWFGSSHRVMRHAGRRGEDTAQHRYTELRANQTLEWGDAPCDWSLFISSVSPTPGAGARTWPDRIAPKACTSSWPRDAARVAS